MSWFRRGGLHEEGAVQGRLVDAVRSVPGVTGQVLAFRSQAKGGGLVSGHVDVPDEATFAAALVAVAAALGSDAGRVVVGLTGATPDGRVIEAADLGLFVRPNGTHILDRLA